MCETGDLETRREKQTAAKRTLAGPGTAPSKNIEYDCSKEVLREFE
jgi:hypothetical protein